MVHPPIVTQSMNRTADRLATVGSFTSLLQLIPVLHIIHRIITHGTTGGDDVLPHVVDWLIAALNFYIGLISPVQSPAAIFGLVAASITLVVHSFFLFVYWLYSPRTVWIWAVYCLVAVIVAIAVALSLIYGAGSARVMAISRVAIAGAFISFMLSLRGLFRVYLDGNVEPMTIVDAALATINASVAVRHGHVIRTFEYPELCRLVLGAVQVLLYVYVLARHVEQEPNLPPPPPPSPEIELQQLPPASSSVLDIEIQQLPAALPPWPQSEVSPSSSQWQTPQSEMSPSSSQWQTPQFEMSPSSSQWQTPQSEMSPSSSQWQTPRSSPPQSP